MLVTESVRCDILVVGAGAAGMMAAITASQAGADVVLVSKAELGQHTATSLARGQFPDKRRGGVPAIAGYDNRPGAYLEDYNLIKQLDAEVPRQLDNLIGLGARITREQSVGGHYMYRAWEGTGAHGGELILLRLARVADAQGVRAIEGCTVAGLMRGGGRNIGAYGVLADGTWLSIYARATILATGGGAGIYHVTSCARDVLGDGCAMALRAGLPLRNIEFMHFYPVGLKTPSGRYIHCSPPTLGMKNARLVNSKGEDIVQKHYGVSLQKALPPPSVRFEWLPRAVAREAAAGPVYLDLRQVPQESWDKLPAMNYKAIARTGLDPRKDLLPFLYMSHAFIGGIMTDTRGRTPVHGLWAAGEVVSGHYAGDNSWGMLPSSFAMGAIVGRSAADDLERLKSPRKKSGREPREVRKMTSRRRGIRPRVLQEEMRQILWDHAGPIRSEPSLQEGLRKLEQVAQRSARMRCRTARDLKEAIEVKSTLLLGEAIVRAALLRQDSRGGHYREDFPRRDDAAWQRPVIVSYDEVKDELKATAGKKVEYA